MNQFVNTEDENEMFRQACERHLSNRRRITEIVSKVKNGEDVNPEDILWVCRIAVRGINKEESNWFDHG